MREHYVATFGALPEPEKPLIGFYLAGYSPGHDQHLGSEWEFVLPAAQDPTRARDDNMVGASWRGIHIPFTRLFFGVDPRVEQILTGLGVNAATIAAFGQAIRTQLLSKVVFEGMPIQDAIGFCRFIIETTIGAATYEIGIASCGGPVNVAVITRSHGFKWVTKPRFTIEEEGD
jgi:hypothetical protein